MVVQCPTFGGHWDGEEGGKWGWARLPSTYRLWDCLGELEKITKKIGGE
jgi:hypothetical protein